MDAALLEDFKAAYLAEFPKKSLYQKISSWYVKHRVQKWLMIVYGTLFWVCWAQAVFEVKWLKFALPLFGCLAVPGILYVIFMAPLHMNNGKRLRRMEKWLHEHRGHRTSYTVVLYHLRVSGFFDRL